MKNKIAIKWLKQALHDLEIAEKVISIGGYDVSAFLSHQSIEKLLKAIFAFKGKKIPKTHYVDELAKDLELDSEIVDSVYELTVDYTFSRYPDVGDHIPYEEYNEEIAKEKVEIAKKVFQKLIELYRSLLEEEND